MTNLVICTLLLWGQFTMNIDSVNEKIREYGYANFEPLSEKWSVYCLEDKTIIKLKVVPSKFLKKDDDYAIESTTIIAAFTPPTLKGQPTLPFPVTDSEKMKVLDKTDMKFDVVTEPWNEYALDDGIKVSIKPVAVSISSTTLHDIRGEAVYQVKQQSIVKKQPLTS